MAYSKFLLKSIFTLPILLFHCYSYGQRIELAQIKWLTTYTALDDDIKVDSILREYSFTLFKSETNSVRFYDDGNGNSFAITYREKDSLFVLTLLIEDFDYYKDLRAQIIKDYDQIDSNIDLFGFKVDTYQAGVGIYFASYRNNDLVIGRAFKDIVEVEK